MIANLADGRLIGIWRHVLLGQFEEGADFGAGTRRFPLVLRFAVRNLWRRRPFGPEAGVDRRNVPDLVFPDLVGAARPAISQIENAADLGELHEQIWKQRVAYAELARQLDRVESSKIENHGTAEQRRSVNLGIQQAHFLDDGFIGEQCSVNMDARQEEFPEHQAVVEAQIALRAKA